MTQDYDDDTPRGAFNYENCIITRRESSTDSEDEGSFHLPIYDSVDDPEPSPELDAFDPVMFITAEHVASTNLSVKETFSLILVLVGRMEKYLDNLQEDEHKKWLKDKTDIMRRALVKHCVSFEGNEGDTIDGAEHLNEKKSSLGNSSRKSLEKSSPVKQRTSVRSRKKNKREFALGESSQTPKTRLRQRKQQQAGRYSDRIGPVKVPKDHQLVYMDRTSYQFRMSETPKKMNCSTPKPQKRNDVAASSSGDEVAKNSDDARTENAKTIKKRTMKNSYKRKAQSFSSQETVEKDQRTKSMKRRAVSLGRANKRKKTNNSFDESDQSNTDARTSSGKRKLYSPAEWLHSLSTVLVQTI